MMRGLVLQWTRATWFGWLLGVPFVIALALAGEAVGIGGSQFLVGAGMGAGIGLMQARMIRSILPSSRAWLLSCIAGLGAPFLATDIAKAAGAPESTYSLFACVAAGGLIAGAWQAILLRARFRGTAPWVAASAAGWMLAAGVAAVSDWLTRSHSIRGLWGAIAYLGVVAFGGVPLGLVTGLCLASMLRRQPAA